MQEALTIYGCQSPNSFALTLLAFCLINYVKAHHINVSNWSTSEVIIVVLETMHVVLWLR